MRKGHKKSFLLGAKRLPRGVVRFTHHKTGDAWFLGQNISLANQMGMEKDHLIQCNIS
jgi:hypothetical protein